MTVESMLRYALAISIGVTFGAITAALAVGLALRVFLWTINMGWVLG